MEKYGKLSRLEITGPINEETPLCVLEEIADAHGVNYKNRGKELINEINITKVPIITNIADLQQCRMIARFVNKNYQWPMKELLIAFNFLMQFTSAKDDELLELIPKECCIGLQTPTNPYSINACILYRTCIHYGFPINNKTTIEQMFHVIKVLRQPLSSLLSTWRENRIYVEKNNKRSELTTFLMYKTYMEKGNIKDTERQNYDTQRSALISHDTLRLLYDSLTNRKQLQKRVIPSTIEGAIGLAALNYGIDISKASDPLTEYHLLHIDGRIDYKPQDIWMKYWYQHNTDMFDLCINFNPIFPIMYYDETRLNVMVRNEGYTYTQINNSSAIELMELAQVQETFYLGKWPQINSQITTITLTPLDEIPYGQLLCYGQKMDVLHPISIEELLALFQANKNFSNPFKSNTSFTSTSINKLKIILRNVHGPVINKQISAETLELREQLLRTISMIEVMLTNDEPTKNFILTYNQVSPETKQLISTTLTNLLYLGMYMRGWLGPGHDFPVLKAPVPPERELEVALNVTKMLAQYNKNIELLQDIGEQITNLPLVKYVDGNYQSSNSLEDGLTIGQRLYIVQQGDSTGNIASCIRLSSNWICSSAHKFITALGFHPPFDIFNLRTIS